MTHYICRDVSLWRRLSAHCGLLNHITPYHKMYRAITMYFVRNIDRSTTTFGNLYAAFF